jgi:hypothetical protein
MDKRLIALAAATATLNLHAPDADADRGPSAMPVGRPGPEHIHAEWFYDAIREPVQREARPSVPMPFGADDWQMWDEVAEDDAWWIAANATPLGSPHALIA